jgi:carbamoyl-phosphate synthase large subunit
LPDVNILLTCAGQRVDIVRAFQHEFATGPYGGKVIVSDADALSPSLQAADLVVELPQVTDPDYGAAVADICRTQNVKVVLPLTDLDPLVLAEAGPAIAAAGAVALLPLPEIAVGCQDKWLCHELLTSRGLPSPPTWLPGAVDVATLPFPVLLKPRMGFAGRDIHRCGDPDELAFFLKYTNQPESVIQQALPGLEFSIDCLADMEGNPLGAVPRRMIQSKGGEQIKGETLDDPQLVDLAVATITGLGLQGPCTIQCFREDGKILGITDINTRFGGAFPLPQAAGAGYPELILQIGAGERPVSRVGKHRVGVAMTRYLDQFIVAHDGERYALVN